MNGIPTRPSSTVRQRSDRRGASGKAWAPCPRNLILVRPKEAILQRERGGALSGKGAVAVDARGGALEGDGVSCGAILVG